MSVFTLVKGAIVAAKVFAVANAPLLLAGSAVVGVCVTAYSAYKAGKKAQQVLQVKTKEKGEPLTTKEKAKYTWRLWAPVVVEGILTIAGISASYYIQARRLAYMTEVANLALATSNELQYKLDKVIEKYPEAQSIVNDIDREKAATGVVNGKRIIVSEVPGNDVFYDPMSGLMWYGDYSNMVSCIADAKEDYYHCGYLSNHELLRRFGIPEKEIPRLVKFLAWSTDYDEHSCRVPRINLICSPLLDDTGAPIKGCTMYIVSYVPANTSFTYDQADFNRELGMDGSPWEDSIMVEDEYDEIARMRGCEKPFNTVRFA